MTICIDASPEIENMLVQLLIRRFTGLAKQVVSSESLTPLRRFTGFVQSPAKSLISLTPAASAAPPTVAAPPALAAPPTVAAPPAPFVTAPPVARSQIRSPQSLRKVSTIIATPTLLQELRSTDPKSTRERPATSPKNLKKTTPNEKKVENTLSPELEAAFTKIAARQAAFDSAQKKK